MTLIGIPTRGDTFNQCCKLVTLLLAILTNYEYCGEANNIARN